MKKNRLGVIKRAETNSKQAVELKNEIQTLKALKGLGVPEVYETGQAIYGSRNYDYVVIEYVDAIRVEKNLNLLSVEDRAEILTQLFEMLAEVHRRGIVNGDVDLKHLFWRKDKKQLLVIDWGNARNIVDTKKRTEFAYDLARLAEIIYSLVTDRQHPPSTGPLNLPGDSALLPGMSPLPIEFRELCQWAPRKPMEGIKAPVTALEMLDAAKQWSSTISGKVYVKKPAPQPKSRTQPWALIFIVVVIAVVGYSQRDSILKLIFPPTPTATQTQETTITQEPTLEKTPSATSTIPTSSDIPTITALPTETATATATVQPMPTPRAYEAGLVFDNKLVLPGNKPCWKRETELENLTVNDGFYRRDQDKYWGFRVLEDEDTIPEERPVDTPIYIDFSQCPDIGQISAIGLNAWIIKIVPERIHPAYAPDKIDPGREFGLFIEDMNGIKREYTLWVDADKLLHLRIRENGTVIYDNSELVVSTIQTDGAFPRTYNKLFIQVFLELNNNGTDTIYLLQGSGKAVDASSLDPAKMILKSTLPASDNVQKIGLVGYGGETQVLIWPLAFYTQK
jgi:tRNA A-37 threonylcarbamoyl transferase component Bud32